MEVIYSVYEMGTWEFWGTLTEPTIRHAKGLGFTFEIKQTATI